MTAAAPDFEAVLRLLVKRALGNDELSLLPLHFEAAVLDRYRTRDGFSIIRTDSVGRVRQAGGWSLDFGIALDDTLLHVVIGDLLGLPAAEREHWASFATTLPASRMFFQMRLSPSACYDDGEVRKWE